LENCGTSAWVSIARSRSGTRTAAELEVDEQELAPWRTAAERMMVHFDAELGVTSQSESSTRNRNWDFEATGADEYPLLLHYP
jgi:alpha,alpha-trehalose phosphorylase